MIADEEHQTLYAEKLRAYFALSGGKVFVVHHPSMPMDKGLWHYQYPGMGRTTQNYAGEPCSKGFHSMDAAMLEALREMGVAGVE